MAVGARVESIDAIRNFRVVLLKFAESANTALSDAEGEMQRVLTWLETEAPNYWQGQVRKRQEIVSRAKEAVRQKKLFKDSTGRQQSAIDEEKALAIAMKNLAEAEQKSAAVRTYSRRLQKEISIYKGTVQRFATDVQSDIPVAIAHLDGYLAKLEAYLALNAAAAGAGGEATSIESGASMARGETEDALPAPAEPVEPAAEEKQPRQNDPPKT